MITDSALITRIAHVKFRFSVHAVNSGLQEGVHIWIYFQTLSLHLPLKTGFLFSIKALTASMTSSLGRAAAFFCAT